MWEQVNKKNKGSYSFFLRGMKQEKTISLRFRHGVDIDLKISTQLVISEKNWDKTKGWPKTKSDFDDKLRIETRLTQIKKSIDDAMDKADFDFVYNKDWLNRLIFSDSVGEKDQNHYLLDSFEKYKKFLLHRTKNGVVGASEGTIKNLNTTIKRLIKYEEHISYKLRLRDIDLIFHENYLEFARSVLKLGANSIGKDIKQIKTICFDEMARGIDIHPQLKSTKFYAPSEKAIFTTLTPDELIRIVNYKGKDYLENAAKWLVIGCWTGARVDDLLNLNSTNLIDYKDTKIIRYLQTKTGKIVALPIHPQVKEILQRNNGEFPRSISDVNFNLYIKEVCLALGMKELVNGALMNPITKRKEKGIFEKWQLVTSHICRRSFATNNFNILPNKLIMQGTGHQSEKVFLGYIGETETDHIDAYLDVWK